MIGLILCGFSLTGYGFKGTPFGEIQLLTVFSPPPSDRNIVIFIFQVISYRSIHVGFFFLFSFFIYNINSELMYGYSSKAKMHRVELSTGNIARIVDFKTS